MITVDIKLLLNCLNGLCRKTLEEAALYCASRSHYEITIQHWLHALVQEERSDLALMLLSQDVSLQTFKQAVLANLEGLPTGNSAKPSISPQLFEWVQDAWLIASVDLHVTKVRSAALLLALIKKRHFYNLAFGAEIFLNLNENHLTTLFVELTQNSVEQESQVDQADQARPSGTEDPFKLYCRDLSELAAQAKIDPVFGRDQEIDQVIDVLARRRKNHPILVGFAGVGKTAIVEGLALRIHQQSVPAFLKNSQLLSLDLAALEAGASVKGEFEKRLKTLIDQIKQAKRPVILFADEAHMLIGAGNHGSNDAANLLKPLLARGELRMIAATTWEEYKKYIEKDPALVRRFQMIRIDEPSVAQTIQMLRGLKPVYERAHSVSIREEALTTAVQLSSRYLSGRQQPDKSIDVLDTAAARVKLALTSVESGWLLQQGVAALQTEVRSLQQEQQLTPSDHLTARIEKLEEELGEQQTLLANYQQDWAAAANLAQKIIELRQLVLADKMVDRVAELNTLLTQFKALKGSDFFNFEVNSDVVAQVVSDWSGVPLGKLLRNEQTLLTELPHKMTTRIRGQSLAIQTVCERIQAAKAGLTSNEQPLGVFLLVGPSGVGKTETALACADLLYGGKQNLVTINMSEFQEKHSLSRLIGSPPGYVGYGEGGVLSEAVRQRPYSVVLLDEIEKAAPDIMNLFYQVFDKGQLNDGEGVEIDFKNTLVFMTSNLASDLITELTKNQTVALDTIRDAIMPSLNQFIMPSLLARMTIVPYHALSLEALIEVSQQKCQQLTLRLFEQRRIQLNIRQEVHQAIAERCQTWGGARQIDFILQQEMFPILTQRCLAHAASDIPLVLQIDLDAQGNWCMSEPSV